MHCRYPAHFAERHCLQIFEPLNKSMELVKATNIHKRFGTVEVLKGVDFSMNKGEIVSIVGSSGAGKSTLLHILGTLDKANAGNVWLNGTGIHQLHGDALSHFRNKHIGFVFQFHHLLPEFNAWENVCIPGWIAGNKRSEVKERAFELLRLLGLGKRMEHKPGTLSGGEQQRVAVARALINKPSIVFADEPTGNLDSANAKELHHLFFDLRQTLEQSFLIVTHNEELAQLSDRIVHMRDGKIIEPTVNF